MVVSGQLHALASGEKSSPPRTNWIGSWVTPGAVLEGME
jgi:hypothetical protein